MQCNTCFIVEYTMYVGSRAISLFAQYPECCIPKWGEQFFFFLLKIIVLLLQIKWYSKIRPNSSFLLRQKRMQWHLNYAVLAVVIPSSFSPPTGYSIVISVAAVVTGEKANGIVPEKIWCIYLFSILWDLCGFKGQNRFWKKPQAALCSLITHSKRKRKKHFSPTCFEHSKSECWGRPRVTCSTWTITS